MAFKESTLIAFAHLGTTWIPCGLLSLSKEAAVPNASSFAYGTNYLQRADAIEVDPVSLGIADRGAVHVRRLLPAHQITFLAGVATPLPMHGDDA